MTEFGTFAHFLISPYQDTLSASLCLSNLETKWKFLSAALSATNCWSPKGVIPLQKLAIKFPAVARGRPQRARLTEGPVLLQRRLQTRNVQSGTLVLIWVPACGGRLPVERPELWAADKKEGCVSGDPCSGRLDLALDPNKHAPLRIAPSVGWEWVPRTS